MAHSPSNGDARSKAIAGYVAGLRFEDLPPSVIKAVKHSVLDTIGSGLFGSTTEWGRIIGDFARAQPGPVAIWGRGGSGFSHCAAMANATMAHGFELDDLHPGSRSHPGAVMTPLALAFAETAGGLTGREMLTALAAGYEVQGRVGIAQGISSFNRGWHPTGTAGSAGAAAAAARLKKLSPEKTQHAIGIAATMPAGLMAAQFGAMVKRLYVGHATWAGMVGADLAASGFTGVPDIFDAPYGGYFEALSDAFKPEALVDRLGQKFEAADIGVKFYPCVGVTQPLLDAIAGLLKKTPFTAADVERIDIRTSAYAKLHAGSEFHPTSVMAAQASARYCVATYIIEGRLFVDEFTPEKLVAPRALDLLSRIDVRADETLDKTPGFERYAEVTVKLRDGRKLIEGRAFAHGSFKDPASWDEVAAKFRDLAGRVAPPQSVERIAGLAEDLETLPDVAVLADALRLRS